MELDYGTAEAAQRRARAHRWLAKAKAKVVHPQRGEVTVPCRSRLCAILNAAEYWKCQPSEIMDAQVLWAPKDARAVRPKEFCKGAKNEKTD